MSSRQASETAPPSRSSGAPVVREVVVGSRSRVWRTLSRRDAIADRMRDAIGHRDLAAFAFTPSDRVWVLSYSRAPDENAALLERLRVAGVDEVVYVSSSSTIVADTTRCYEYPRAKQTAEAEARRLLGAKILTLGLMYEDPAELPAGENMATAYSELAEFMLAPSWPDEGGRRKYLFRLVQRPFGSALERELYRLYGRLMAAAGGRPCLLRPVDLILRALHMRWYGYVYLSNRLWMSMRS